MKRYQYRVFPSISIFQLEFELNSHAYEDWELFYLTPLPPNEFTETNMVHAILRKQI